MNPVTTLISLLGIATIISVAIGCRKKWPFVSLGLLWFFVGQGLEAGPIPLELYFEHRNYLPLLGPLVAVCSLLPLLNTKSRHILPLLLVLFIGVESFLTWQSAVPWGDEKRLMQTALLEHPDSLRAQQYVANQLIIDRRYPEALALQERLAVKFPEHAATRLSILNLRCLLQVLTTADIGATQEFLESSGHDLQLIAYLAPLTANAATHTCDALGFAEVQSIMDALLRNPILAHSGAVRGATHYRKGVAYKMTGDLDKAVTQLDLSYLANPQIDIRLQQVVWLLGAGRTDDAEHYLLLARQHEKGRFLRHSLRAADLDALRQNIDAARAMPSR